MAVDLEVKVRKCWPCLCDTSYLRCPSKFIRFTDIAFDVDIITPRNRTTITF
jgi:hypothetical protein